MGNTRTPGPLCQQSRGVRVLDGTSCRAASPVPATAGRSVVGPANWGLHDKLIEAMRRTAPRLPAEMREQFLALLSPTNAAITAGVLIAWASSHAFGVGEVADVVLLGIGAVTIGWQVGQAARDLADFFEIASSAKSDADLDLAADHLARFVSVVGITVLLALISRAASRLRLRGKAAPAEAAPSPPPEAPPEVPPAAEPVPAVVPASGRGAPFADFPSFRERPIGDVLSWLRSHGFEEVQKPTLDGLGKTKSSHIWFRRAVQADGTSTIEAVRIDARGNAVKPSIPREGEVAHRFAKERVAYSEPRHMHKELIDDSMVPAYLRKKGARYPGKSRPVPFSDEGRPNGAGDHRANHIWLVP